MSIVSVCLTPGIQRSVALDSLNVGEVNRLRQPMSSHVSGKGINVCRVPQRLKIAACCLLQGGSNADELMLLAQREGLNLIRCVHHPARCAPVRQSSRPRLPAAVASPN